MKRALILALLCLGAGTPPAPLMLTWSAPTNLPPGTMLEIHACPARALPDPEVIDQLVLDLVLPPLVMGMFPTNVTVNLWNILPAYEWVVPDPTNWPTVAVVPYTNFQWAIPPSTNNWGLFMAKVILK